MPHELSTELLKALDAASSFNSCSLFASSTAVVCVNETPLLFSVAAGASVTEVAVSAATAATGAAVAAAVADAAVRGCERAIPSRYAVHVSRSVAG